MNACEECNGSGMVAVGRWGSRPPRVTCPLCEGRRVHYPQHFTSGKISHDPQPRVNLDGDGREKPNSRHPRYSDCSALCVDRPRPEYDNHNPILVWLRKLWPDPSPDTHLSLVAAVLDDSLKGYAPEHVRHARRVLTKLAAIA